MKPSGIGGQAVIEGIMMRNKDKYSKLPLEKVRFLLKNING